MRLTHIFWSLAVLSAIIVLPVLLFSNHGKLQGGPELFGTFVIFWWITDVVTPVALIAAWLKRRSIQERFSFTLLSVLNLYFGLMGTYHLLRAGSVHLYEISFIIFLLNLAWAAIIVYYQLRSQEINPNSA